VVRPEAGRALCRQAILRYVREDAPEAYEERLAPLREQVRSLVLERLTDEFGGEAAP
jgi:hypothetical protein